MNRETPPILPAEAGTVSNGNRPPLIQFDRYVLDLRRGALRSGDSDIDIRPKTFLVLKLLVENAGRLVSKDEIIAAIWPDVTVTDDSLVQCVKELRRALGEDGERLVRTVPRRGYRLEARTAFAVSGPPSDPSPPSASVEPPADAAPGRAEPAQRAAALSRVERRLAAILAADIAGYSRLMGCDEVGTLTALKAHRRERLDPTIARHHGRIVKTTGDGALVEFPSVVDAVACAVAMQRAMLAINADIPEDRRIVFRIGINVGDIIIDGGDIFGDGVNVAARLEALCDPGGVCISRSANEQIRDKLSLVFADLGEQAVKNVARPIGVFALAAKDIAALPEEALPQPEPPEPGGPPVPVSRRRIGAIVAGTIMLAALLLLGLWRLGPTDPATAVRGSLPRFGKPAIAVLPFASPVGDGDYFAEGMTDDVINALGRFSSQTVMSRNAVATYRGRSVTPQQVGRDLSVQYILEGTVRRFGDQLRVTAELTGTDRGRVLWSGRFDDALRDIFAVQDRITTQVVRGLAVKVTQVEEQRSQAKPTESLEAYDYVLRARRAASEAKRSTNVDARALLRKAIEPDPRYGAAYTGLGETYRVAVAMGWAQSPDAALKEAEALAYKALNLND
jgi:adenylate cyclase